VPIGPGGNAASPTQQPRTDRLGTIEGLGNALDPIGDAREALGEPRIGHRRRDNLPGAGLRERDLEVMHLIGQQQRTEQQQAALTELPAHRLDRGDALVHLGGEEN